MAASAVHRPPALSSGPNRLQPAERRIAAHLGQAPDGQREIPVHDAALRQVGDGAARAGVAVVVRVEVDAAGLDRREADDALEQRGFARAVGSQQAHATSAAQVQVDVVQRGHAPVGNRQVVDEEAVRGHGSGKGDQGAGVGGFAGHGEHVVQRAVRAGPEGFFRLPPSGKRTVTRAAAGLAAGTCGITRCLPSVAETNAPGRRGPRLRGERRSSSGSGEPSPADRGPASTASGRGF